MTPTLAEVRVGERQEGWPDDVAFEATIFPDWTILKLPNGDVFGFSRDSGKAYKLPHPDVPFVMYPRSATTQREGEG